jgi:hypothetical protein
MRGRGRHQGHPTVGNAAVDDAAACIDHIVKVAGIDHVGIGSDFDGIPSVPRGLEDVSKMPNVIAALLRRGCSDQDIQKIIGENFLRVVQRSWATDHGGPKGLVGGAKSRFPAFGVCGNPCGFSLGLMLPDGHCSNSMSMTWNGVLPTFWTR